MKLLRIAAVSMAACSILGEGGARAQAPRPPRSGSGAVPYDRPFVEPPASSEPSNADQPLDERVFKSGEELPAPLQAPPPDELTVPLPTEPIEPYLLTPRAGPFMVNAYIYRGHHAAKKAQALAMELRRDYKLPAYVYFLKIKPGNSNIRDVPPTASREGGQIDIAAEAINEAAVLVGHAKSIEQAAELRKQVKKIRPKVLEGERSAFFWRDGSGLKRATVTANPLVPAQDLYPGRPKHGAPSAPPPGALVHDEFLRSRYVKPVDPLVKELNEGAPYTVYKCPAPYSMIVAEFTGRSMLADAKQDTRFRLANLLGGEDSPLRTAQDDALELAKQLEKHPKVKALGLKPYVYHDRRSSKVLLGEFGSPDDPRARRVRQTALTIAIRERKDRDNVRYLAPSPFLFQVPKPQQ